MAADSERLEPESTRRTYLMVVAIIGITLIGFGLRVYRMNDQSVWRDEGLALYLSRPAIDEMMRRIIELDGHPPLHHLIMHATFALFGFGDYQARFVSVVCGTAVIPLTFMLALRMFNDRTAILAAILVAISQICVMYSQEARPYAVFWMFTVMAAWLYIEALRSRRASVFLAFIVAAVLAVYSHYFGVFFASVFLLHALVYRKRNDFPISWIVTGVAVAVVLMLPWYATGMIPQRTAGPAAFGDLPPWFDVEWTTALSTTNLFNNGKPGGPIYPSPRWTFVVGALLFSVPALLSLRPLFSSSPESTPQEREGLILLLAWWVFPMFLVIAILSPFLSMAYDARYVGFCVFPYYILVARGITQLKPRLLGVLMTIGILAYTSYTLPANYSIPYKEDYRSALAHLASEYQPDDCCVFAPFGDPPFAWNVYHADGPELEIAALDDIHDGAKSDRRVWLIMYRRVPAAVEATDLAKETMTRTRDLLDIRKYFWIQVALYGPRRVESPPQAE